MTILHKNIADSDRHEPKGASTAAAGQVLISNGDETTDFAFISYNDIQDLPDLENVLALNLESSSTLSTQAPSAADTPLQVKFNTTSNDDITIDSAGAITFSTSKTYLVKFRAMASRATGTAGVANLLIAAFLNGTQISNTVGVGLENNASITPINMELIFHPSVSDVLTFSVIRDSGGVDAGGLYQISSSHTGWADVPSASVELYSFVV